MFYTFIVVKYTWYTTLLHFLSFIRHSTFAFSSLLFLSYITDVSISVFIDAVQLRIIRFPIQCVDSLYSAWQKKTLSHSNTNPSKERMNSKFICPRLNSYRIETKGKYWTTAYMQWQLRTPFKQRLNNRRTRRRLHVVRIVSVHFKGAVLKYHRWLYSVFWFIFM